MKKLLIFISVLFLASCSSENPEAINKQIISYKDKINTYNKKIAELESKLESDSLPQSVSTGTAVIIKEMFAQEFEHHAATPDHAQRVGNAPAINVGRRTVNRLEHGDPFRVEVSAGGDSHPSLDHGA